MCLLNLFIAIWKKIKQESLEMSTSMEQAIDGQMGISQVSGESSTSPDLSTCFW